MSTDKPLILFTNDDGIDSPGLRAVVEAFADSAELLVVAPQAQQSGMGRSMPSSSEGRIIEQEMTIAGQSLTVYGVDGSPAQAVQHGMMELAKREPALVVSGINYGENTGNGVTISGTVGAALEAASFGIPAIAVSQQTPVDLHLSYSNAVDFSAAAHFTRQFGLWLMTHNRPEDVEILKLDVPAQATLETPWRITRLSRNRVYWPTRPERVALDEIGRVGYAYDTDPSQAEPNSDVYAVLHEGVISLTPMTLDMTARVDLKQMEQMIRAENDAVASPNGRRKKRRASSTKKTRKATAR
jgi:5'-nucleotidase